MNDLTRMAMAVSTDTIRALQVEAGEAGDTATVALCAKALDLSLPTAQRMAARTQIEQQLAEARAMDDTLFSDEVN